jgi:hypothetical protein
MKTYAETKSATPFNWKVELEKRLKSKSSRDRKLSSLSSNWVTCACGNQSNTIGRDSSGSPFDRELRHLGGCFSDEVDDGAWKKALKILKKIEKRSAKIEKRFAKLIRESI